MSDAHTAIGQQYDSRSESDSEFLLWLRDRLVHVYAESVNVDFVQRVAKIANRLEMIDGVIDRLKEFNDGLLAERSTGHQNPG